MKHICIWEAHGHPEVCDSCNCDKVTPLDIPMCGYRTCTADPIPDSANCWQHSHQREREAHVQRLAGLKPDLTGGDEEAHSVVRQVRNTWIYGSISGRITRLINKSRTLLTPGLVVHNDYVGVAMQSQSNPIPPYNSSYKRYLASREWALKKHAVRKRSGGTCERCHKHKATEVHHITYAHLYDEPLVDLLDVCRGCHEFESGISNIDPAIGPIPVLNERQWAEFIKSPMARVLLGGRDE
jgi:hypothetical protein